MQLCALCNVVFAIFHAPPKIIAQCPPDVALVRRLQTLTLPRKASENDEPASLFPADKWL